MCLWKIQGGDYDDKTYEYDNVFQIDDFCIILLKRRFLRYLVQKLGEPEQSVCCVVELYTVLVDGQQEGDIGKC